MKIQIDLTGAMETAKINTGYITSMDVTKSNLFRQRIMPQVLPQLMEYDEHRP